jgi:hypothetical protein
MGYVPAGYGEAYTRGVLPSGPRRREAERYWHQAWANKKGERNMGPVAQELTPWAFAWVIAVVLVLGTLLVILGHALFRKG